MTTTPDEPTEPAVQPDQIDLPSEPDVDPEGKPETDPGGPEGS